MPFASAPAGAVLAAALTMNPVAAGSLPHPLALSLSKGRSCFCEGEGRCFDKLSTNGSGATAPGANASGPGQSGISAPGIPTSGAAGQGTGTITSAPPPVTIQQIPSSPALPQPALGGRVESFPLPPATPPIQAPVAPAAPLAGPQRPLGDTPEAAGPAAPVQGPPAPGAARVRQPGALDLVSAYDLGRDNDPTYQAAIAERDVNRETAGQTITAYLPQASYSYNNIPTEGGARHVATVTQPILSISGLATLKQRGPRRAYADATLEVRAQDLATRTMTAVADIIKATEAIALNDARITAFRTQSARADRLYQSGQGTVTDARDIAVRYEQALANRILLQSDLIAASTRLKSITGQPVPERAFRLPDQFGAVRLEAAEAYLGRQEAANPQIEAARQTERINRLEARRIRGSIFPVVGASATYTRRNELSDSYVGISVSAPLNAASLFQVGAANATVRRSFEERRLVEERARTELERLHALVDGGRQALAINAKAIAAAELSVEANSRSYEGGVRTNVDVVNAIQTVFEVKNAYVQAATTLATNYLNLQLLAGVDPEDALATTQAFLLAR